MPESPPASIVIVNYNYGRFLKDAIDSALSQTYPETQVIVVDDGSTDDSPRVIARYGDRVLPVLKENGGQASAFNAGFGVSRGEAICFLDADDLLLPTAVEQAVAALRDPDVARVHWPLWATDRHGDKTGIVVPSHQALAEGDLRDVVLRKGPVGYVWSPTTGNAWARRFLERVLPIPEPEYVICADTYLALLAPFFGLLKRLPTPQGMYRDHGSNNRLRISHDDVTRILRHSRAVLRDHLGDPGFDPDLNVWRDAWWWPDLEQATQELAALVSAEDRFILVDEDQFGDHFALRHQAIPFLDQEGRSGGSPPDDATPIRELERLRRSGASLLVVAWPAFRWLEDHPELHRQLLDRFPRLLHNDRLIVFDLRDAGHREPPPAGTA